MYNAGQEFTIIDRYFRQGFISGRDVVVPIGDDASVISDVLFQQQDWVQSIDTQIADVHFPAHAPANRIAARALRCAVSDLAAMGAKPHSFHLAITLPEMDEAWLESFSSGLSQTARQLHVGLLGGDTTRGNQLVITIAVQGSVPSGQCITRSNASADDDVWISGVVGAAACAVPIVIKDPTCKSIEADAYFFPSIDLALGESLRGVASACIDVSDGLLQDGQHIATQSQLAMVLNSELIPTHRPYGHKEWPLCLNGGDDYRLLFTAPQSRRQVLEKIPAIHRIGQMLPDEPEVVILRDQKPLDLSNIPPGYQHF